MGKSIVIGTVWLSFQERNNCNRIMPICHHPKGAIEGWRNFAASKSSCLKKKVINGRRRGRLGSVGYTWLMVLRNVWRPRDKAWTPNYASILVGRDFYCFKVPWNGFCKSDRIPGNFLMGDIFCKNVMMRASRVYKGRNIMKKVFKLLCKKSLLNRNWRTWHLADRDLK